LWFSWNISYDYLVENCGILWHMSVQQKNIIQVDGIAIKYTEKKNENFIFGYDNKMAITTQQALIWRDLKEIKFSWYVKSMIDLKEQEGSMVYTDKSI